MYISNQLKHLRSFNSIHAINFTLNQLKWIRQAQISITLTSSSTNRTLVTCCNNKHNLNSFWGFPYSHAAATFMLLKFLTVNRKIISIEGKYAVLIRYFCILLINFIRFPKPFTCIHLISIINSVYISN